jgi:hypothetical protein
MTTERQSKSGSPVRDGSGKFATDRQKARKAARKGDQRSQQSSTGDDRQDNASPSEESESLEGSESDPESVPSTDRSRGGSSKIAGDPDRASASRMGAGSRGGR